LFFTGKKSTRRVAGRVDSASNQSHLQGTPLSTDRCREEDWNATSVEVEKRRHSHSRGGCVRLKQLINAFFEGRPEMNLNKGKGGFDVSFERGHGIDKILSFSESQKRKTTQRMDMAVGRSSKEKKRMARYCKVGISKGEEHKGAGNHSDPRKYQKNSLVKGPGGEGGTEKIRKAKGGRLGDWGSGKKKKER